MLQMSALIFLGGCVGMYGLTYSFYHCRGDLLMKLASIATVFRQLLIEIVVCQQVLDIFSSGGLNMFY